MMGKPNRKKTKEREENTRQYPRMEFTSKYIFIIQKTRTDVFDLNPEGLLESYQFLSQILDIDMDEEEVLPFRKSSRPVLGINHR